MDFSILGPLEVRAAGRVVPVGGHRERTSLAMLLLEANRVVPVDRLIDAVWDDAPPATARGQIQICISSLRRRVASESGNNDDHHDDNDDELIVTRSPGYLLRVPDDALDVHRFEQQVAAGRERARASPDEAAGLFRRALALWRGPALSDVRSELVRPGATRLNEHRLVVLGECLDSELRCGRHHEAIAELAELVDLHPLREQFRALLMLALYRAGRQSEALDSYRRTRDVLNEELGLDPGEELQRLHAAILASDGDLDTSNEHAVDVAPEPVTLPARLPEVHPAERRPHLLPSSIHDFTGRLAIINKIRDGMLGADSHSNAVPLTVVFGQGGAGKTTLALHTAHLLEGEFEDGQLFARLRAGVHSVSPSDVLERFLRALGVDGPAVPSSTDERAEMFRDLLSGRRMLIILDDAMSEQQVLPLMPGTASCAVLVTSRRRMGLLPAATRVELGPLTRASSLDLLRRIVGPERTAAEPDQVELLCALCGDLPLPLRIVGARLAARPHWSIADLVDRLADEPRRLDELHHGEMGVRASIRVTYDGLSDDARVLFRRLALLDAPAFASWVAAPLLQADVWHAQDVLEELTEAFLVETTQAVGGGPVRYRLHDITSPFASERLVEESAEERRAALERWFGALLALASEAHRREYSGDFMQQASLASRWALPDRLVDRLLEDPLAWFEQERSSIVSAIRQAAATGMVDHAWGLALSAVTLFESRAYFTDWRTTHEAALAAAVRSDDRRGEAAMRYSMGSLHMFEQRFDAARGQFELALEMYSTLSDRHGAALVLRNVAYLDRLVGDLDSALRLGEEAMQVFRTYGDRVAEAHALQNLAEVRILFGDEAEAQQHLERARLLCDQVGNRRVGAQVDYRLGELFLLRGDLDDAQTTYERALEAVRATGDQIGECYALLGAASVQLARGESAPARDVLSAARELADRCGDRVAVNRIHLVRAEAELALGDLDAALADAERAISGFDRIGAGLLRARGLTIMGRVHAAAERTAEAVEAWQAAQGIVRQLRLGAATRLGSDLDAYLSAVDGRVDAAGSAAIGDVGG